MKAFGAVVLGMAALVAATAASAQAQIPEGPDTGQMARAPALPPAPRDGKPQSRALFTIGGVEVHLWAPVEPPYDPDLNRNLAADPLWAG